MPVTTRTSGLTGKPGGAQPAEARALAVGRPTGGPVARRHPLGPADLVGPEGEGPGGRDRRVLLAERPGGEVAGVGEGPGPGGHLALVQGLEVGGRQVHLAPDLEPAGVGAGRRVQPVRASSRWWPRWPSRPRRSRRRPGSRPAGSARPRRRATWPPRRPWARSRSPASSRSTSGSWRAQSGRPGPELGLGEGVVEAHHRRPGGGPRRRGRGRRPDRLGRRVGGHELGMVLLDRPQLDGPGRRSRRRGSPERPGRSSARCDSAMRPRSSSARAAGSGPPAASGGRRRPAHQATMPDPTTRSGCRRRRRRPSGPARRGARGARSGPPAPARG